MATLRLTPSARHRAPAQTRPLVASRPSTKLCQRRAVSVFARAEDAAAPSGDDQPLQHQTLQHSGLFGMLALVALCTVAPAIIPAATGGGGGGSFFSHGFGGGGGGFFSSLLPLAHAGTALMPGTSTHCDYH